MNKFLKVLLISFLLVSCLLVNFKTNISYCESYDKIDKLILNQEKEKDLSKRIKYLDYILNEVDTYKSRSTIMEKSINLDCLKITQTRIIKTYFEKQLKIYKSYENDLINEIESERLEALKESNLSYIKGFWPLKDYTYISSSYGYRIHPISKQLSFHTGIDIPAPKNTDVLSSDDGIVVYANYQRGYGNVVKIKHFDSKVTVYAHNNIILVEEGDIVKKGQVISKVGSTGNSTGNHLHFEVILDNRRINPINAVTKDI